MRQETRRTGFRGGKMDSRAAENDVRTFCWDSAGRLFRQQPGAARRGRARRGITTVELLIALIIVSIVMYGVYGLIGSSWRSYQSLLWQNKANQEARQTLDDICDLIRFAGYDQDMIRTTAQQQTQVDSSSGADLIGVIRIGSIGTPTYCLTQQDATSSIFYLTRLDDEGTTSVGQYVSTVEFEYEYRQPASLANPTWALKRVLIPSGDIFYLVKTVYVTVNVTIPASVTGDQVYQRRLTSAVSLRAPYNTAAPPAQRIPTVVGGIE